MSTNSDELRRMLARVSRLAGTPAEEPASYTAAEPAPQAVDSVAAQEPETPQAAELTSISVEELNDMFGLSFSSPSSTSVRAAEPQVSDAVQVQDSAVSSVAENTDADDEDSVDVEEDNEDDEDEGDNEEQPSDNSDTQQLPSGMGHSLADYTTSRFSGAAWFDAIKNQKITIVGAGGIGSWVALMLSRFNPKSIIIYDDDTVDISNLAGQFYTVSQIGIFKVDAVSTNMKNYSGFYKTVTMRERFKADSSCSDIVISCLDNMYSRKVVFDRWVKHVNECANPKNCLFIDGRLAAETLQVYAVCGDEETSIRRYKDSLFSDSEAVNELCSYKQTSFMANMIGSIIANDVLNFVASKLPDGILREIPFFIEYGSELMYFKTVM